jgi:hypothetical protein
VSISEMVASTCPSGALVGQTLVADNDHCDNNNNALNGWNWTTNNVRVGPMTTLTGCTGTGTPAPTPPTWTTAYDFCETTQKGGGCSLGFVCVPKLAAPARHCILQAGATTCPGNYANEGVEPYYSSLDDTRSCGVTCSGICGKSGGSCGSLFQIHAYLGTSCTGSNDFLGANRDDCGQSSPLQSFKVTLGSDAVNPTCAPNYPTSGAALAAAPQTLCCL